MQTVICNSIGIHVECSKCGASKPHYNSSCEPCPLIPDAECLPVKLPAFRKWGNNSVIKVLSLTDFIKVLNHNNFSTVSAGKNELIVSDSFDQSSEEITETEFTQHYNKAIDTLTKLNNNE